MRNSLKQVVFRFSISTLADSLDISDKDLEIILEVLRTHYNDDIAIGATPDETYWRVVSRYVGVDVAEWADKRTYDKLYVKYLEVYCMLEDSVSDTIKHSYITEVLYRIVNRFDYFDIMVSVIQPTERKS